MAELVAKTHGLVTDPTAGVGSTLVAAKVLGRPSVGVELDEAYCEIIATRLQRTEMLWTSPTTTGEQVAFELEETP